MATETLRAAVAKFGSYERRHVRTVLEAEMIAACERGESGTQAHVGQLEMLAGVGAELDRRSALIPPPPFVEVNRENGVRLSFSVRVF